MSNHNVKPIIVTTDELALPSPAQGVWANRAAAYAFYDTPGVPACSIVVTGYNRLSKTQYCLECILKNTQNVDYELILVDNGSSDGTYEFFQSVPYEKKKIIRITKNVGQAFPLREVRRVFSGKYLVQVSNDIYVTKNWLSNLIACYESDEKIGFVEPVSSNVSNLQEVDIRYANLEEMQRKAAVYNRASDPTQWEERMRLISILAIWTRPILDIVGVYDQAFVHDFAEDDICARIRRAGYRLMLCRDTWVCHDHDFRANEDKDPELFRKTLEGGAAAYREKYHGLDGWDDVNNLEPRLLASIASVSLPASHPARVLVADGRCGTPLLEIRNLLRRRGIAEVESFAFTTHAKYFCDLQSVADDVRCDRIDFIQSHYADGDFDIAALCEPLNTYPSPVALLQRLYNFLKPGGLLLFKLRNTDDYNAFLRSAGLGGVTDGDLPAAIPTTEVSEILRLFGGLDIIVEGGIAPMDEKNQQALLTLLRAVKPTADQNDFNRLLTQDYLFRVTKG